MTRNNLKAYSKLAALPLDEIKAENITGYIAHRQTSNVQVSTINRDLASLRRIFNLAVEWGKVSTILPRVRLQPGENHRARVPTPMEEAKYLESATAIGNSLNEAYEHALEGIRATQRGQQPKRPDAFLLRDVVTLLIVCGLRPAECFRLKWQETIRDGAIEVHTGKGRGSRRRIPMNRRGLAILDMRKASSTSEWVLPSETRSGHIEGSTLRKQHVAAIKRSGVTPFVLYSLRHSAITRWAKHIAPYTLYVLAGHTDMNTTKRYVHPNEADLIEEMAKAQGGHSCGHITESTTTIAQDESSAIN